MSGLVALPNHVAFADGWTLSSVECLGAPEKIKACAIERDE